MNSTIVLIFIGIILALLLVAAAAGMVRYRRLHRQLERGDITEMPEVKKVYDCGADSCVEAMGTASCATCGLSHTFKAEPDYFDDEELDAYRGVPSDKYSEQQIEDFRYVFETMRPEDVANWVTSLQLRGVELPDQLKDEVWAIISDL